VAPVVVVLRGVRTAVLIAAISVALALACEGAVRLVGRLRLGHWPVTTSSMIYDAVRLQTSLYRRHPFLLAAPLEGSHIDVSGMRASFNSLGYRSPERPVTKPAGVFRILCAGGSTTFDAAAQTDERTWPWRLEAMLREQGSPVEVWNAGLPGWTSLENLVSLEIRDVDLAPDVVVLFQGINDLQPAAHVPFDPQYETPHARMMLEATGFGIQPLPWYQRSLALEWARTIAGVPVVVAPAPPPGPPAPRRTTLSEQGVATFERNVRSFLAVARAHRAKVLLVTQTIRLRERGRSADIQQLERWIPELEGEAAVTEIERLNDVMRTLADNGDALLADAARDVAWTDRDFADSMHFSRDGEGSEKLAGFLVEHIQSILRADTPAAPAP
jgi:lysophospholipase L1-like esterase